MMVSRICFTDLGDQLNVDYIVVIWFVQYLKLLWAHLRILCIRKLYSQGTGEERSSINPNLQLWGSYSEAGSRRWVWRRLWRGRWRGGGSRGTRRGTCNCLCGTPHTTSLYKEQIYLRSNPMHYIHNIISTCVNRCVHIPTPFLCM